MSQHIQQMRQNTATTSVFREHLMECKFYNNDPLLFVVAFVVTYSPI